MKKRYFWAWQIIKTKRLLLRFRSEAERQCWINNEMQWHHPEIRREFLEATHPEVRRIQRRIKQGEPVSFPVEVME